MADKIERDELVKMLASLPNSGSCMATYGPPANYQNITVFRGGDGAWVPLGMTRPQADNRRIRTVQTHKTSANRMPTKEKNMIKLPEPTFDGSKVSEAIAKRRSIRQYDGHALDEQTIANLCYFSAGITDNERGFCANPTACNCHQIDLYIATDKYCAKYIPAEHALDIIEEGDFRAEMAIQPFAKEASVQFIYVINAKSFEKFPGNPDHKVKYGYTDSAIMATNTCLYATSIGLGSVMRGMFDPAIVAPRLHIPAEDEIVLTVSVG